MVESFKFSRTPEIFFGAGSFEKIAGILQNYGRRAFLLTGKSSFIEGERGKWLTDELEGAGILYEVAAVPGEPDTGLTDAITLKARQFGPSVVAAIGGGSVIDAGKALSAMIPVTGKVWDYLEGNPQIRPHPGKKVTFIAVPTTAGTGSEATKNAVLSTSGTPVLKRSLRHDNFFPDLAIVDPLLTISCPPEVTAASGLDAITQLLEAYVSTQASPVTDALAYSGLVRGFRSIRRVVEEGTDVGARADMSYAALISGIVLANAGLGAVHGFASVLGAHYAIPHGVVCGTLLGAVTRFNIGKLKEKPENRSAVRKYTEAGRLACSEKGKDDRYYLDFLSDFLDNLIDRLNIPRLNRFGVRGGEAAALASETGIKNNPVSLDREELERILVSRI